MTTYKLTREDFTTRNDMLWGEGVEHAAPGNGKMCRKAYIHAYRSPACAAFFAPIHDIEGYRVLWECDADIEREEVDKLGCTRVKTLRQVFLPTLTTEQRIRIAIRCAKLVCGDAAWNAWAAAWLSGADRSTEAAWVAWSATEAREAAWVAWAASLSSAAVGWASRVAAWAAQAAWGGAAVGASIADIHQIIKEEA